MVLIPIESIKPDPNQPRKYKDQDQIDAMAVSIQKEGLINPIEVDKDYMIVTGEMRYQACKKARLTEIACRIIEPGKHRFRRQLLENIHHNTMTDWDTGVAFKKLLKIENPPKKSVNDKGFNYLARLCGLSNKVIGEYVRILKTSGKLQEKAKSGGISAKYVAQLHRIKSPEIKAKMKKVLENIGKIGSTEVITKFTSLLNLFPECAEEAFMIFESPIPSEKKIIKINSLRESKEISLNQNAYFESLASTAKKLERLLASPPQDEMVAASGLLGYNMKSAAQSLQNLQRMLNNNQKLLASQEND